MGYKVVCTVLWNLVLFGVLGAIEFYPLDYKVQPKYLAQVALRHIAITYPN